MERTVDAGFAWLVRRASRSEGIPNDLTCSCYLGLLEIVLWNFERKRRDFDLGGRRFGAKLCLVLSTRRSLQMSILARSRFSLLACRGGGKLLLQVYELKMPFQLICVLTRRLAPSLKLRQTVSEIPTPLA